MSNSFSGRTDPIRPFLAMEVMERAFALERAGESVIHLEIGEPDFAPPPAAVEACERALRDGHTRYTEGRGLLELREAIAANYSARHGLEIDPERVLVTPGCSPAMMMIFSLLVDPGDEVILASPHYPCYPNFVHLCGGTPVLIPTRAEDGYRMDPEAVRRAITKRTRAILVASPANPTGAVQEPDVIEALGGFGLPLLSDEIYDGLVYEGAHVTSALKASDQAYIFDGFSKRYAMTGFRLGYVIVPPEAVRRLQVMGQTLFISTSEFVQYAGIAALEHGAPMVSAMREEYDRRREFLLGGLRKLGFRVPVDPRGAFHVFAEAKDFGSDSLKLAMAILEKAKVAVTPGIDFGEDGEGWLRFSYANSLEAIEEGLSRLERVLPEFR